MRVKKTLTKRPLAFRSIRLSDEDAQTWRAAAAKLGVSQSEFLRRALRENSNQALSAGRESEIGMKSKAKEPTAATVSSLDLVHRLGKKAAGRS
jgi:ribbon-helix-helix CopG family protein